MERSEVMRRVKARDTSPERAVRALLRRMGFSGYRLDRADLPGRPDIAFIGRRRAIFVHGCFWHGHGCKRGARVPKTNTDYWLAKIARNRSRDLAVDEALAGINWRRLVIWECALKDMAGVEDDLRAFLTG